jgi:signal peptidase I
LGDRPAREPDRQGLRDVLAAGSHHDPLTVRRLLVTIACVVGALVVALPLLAAVGVMHLYRIESSSMEPTMHCARPGLDCLAARSDRVVVLKYVIGSPARGDLVAFHTPPLAAVRCGAGGTFLKRVIGLPGDTWAEHDGVVSIDGRRLPEPYVPAGRRDDRTIAAERIPPNHYFLMGDNRQASCDSRSWGTVAQSAIIGKVVATYWPLSRAKIQ